MKRAWRWLQHFHRIPMATRVADDLYDAEKQLLQYEAQAGFAQAMVDYYAKRVKTLTTRSNAHGRTPK